MSESLSDAEWRAEQERRFRRQMDDLERGWERGRQRVPGFIPGDVWKLWPTLLLASVIGGLVAFGVSELLAHYLSLAATACR